MAWQVPGGVGGIFLLTCNNSRSFCHSEEWVSELSSSRQGLSNSIFFSLEKKLYIKDICDITIQDFASV